MKKCITLLIIILFVSCNKKAEISITKVSGSPEYVNAKLNMIMNQTEKEHIIFNLDDDILRNELMDVKPKVHGFSLEKRDKIIFNVNASKIYSENENKLIDLKDFALPGKHNLSNALAAATTSRLIGVPDEPYWRT